MPRAIRHLLLLLITTGSAGFVWVSGNPASHWNRLSLVSAWVCFALFAAVLALGPLATLRTGRPVLNNLLRRDLGIWAALAGLLHLISATVVVMTPDYFRTYITGPPEAPLPGLAGWVGTVSIVGGYVAGIVFILLLLLSSNRSLRRLGSERWKRLQRNATWAFWLTAIHGMIFQVIERRTGLWLATLLLSCFGVLLLRRQARRLVTSSLGSEQESQSQG